MWKTVLSPGLAFLSNGAVAGEDKHGKRQQGAAHWVRPQIDETRSMAILLVCEASN